MSGANGLPVAAEDAASIRDEWIVAVNDLTGRIEEWAKELDWSTRRAPKRMSDPTLGAYEVPMLLMQRWDVRLLLDPVGRFIVGADGRVDLYVMPQYDDLAALFRKDGTWCMRVEQGRSQHETVLTRDTFRDTIESFAGRHAEA